MRVREGPTKNPLPDDRETPSRNEGTMPLLVFLFLVAKDLFLNLVGFHVLLLKYD